MYSGLARYHNCDWKQFIPIGVVLVLSTLFSHCQGHGDSCILESRISFLVKEFMTSPEYDHSKRNPRFSHTHNDNWNSLFLSPLLLLLLLLLLFHFISLFSLFLYKLLYLHSLFSVLLCVFSLPPPFLPPKSFFHSFRQNFSFFLSFFLSFFPPKFWLLLESLTLMSVWVPLLFLPLSLSSLGSHTPVYLGIRCFWGFQHIYLCSPQKFLYMMIGCLSSGSRN